MHDDLEELTILISVNDPTAGSKGTGVTERIQVNIGYFTRETPRNTWYKILETTF